MNRTLRRLTPICTTLALTLASVGALYAQSSGANAGTVRGAVLDPSGAIIKDASVEIANPVSHYEKTVQTDAQGNFGFDNIPFGTYHLTASAPGFQPITQDATITSPVPVQIKFSMSVGTATSSVTVVDAGDLVETDPSTHTDVDRDLFDKLPLASGSSSLSSLVTMASPGVSADSNGLFHGLGDHASNSFSIDGQPITDQQSKTFSNQLPLEAVQSMEVIEGAPPAEFGDKTSLVIVVTTRSGLGATEPHGDVNFSYGSFGSTSGGGDFVNGGEKFGNFISLGVMDSGRFLDPPELGILHDRGNEENAFDRFDFKPTQADGINVNLTFTRSWFQTPNSYDAQSASAWNGLIANNNGLGPNGQPVGSADQRSQIRSFNFAPAWTRLFGAKAVLSLGVFARQDQYNYYPSNNPFADLTPDLQTLSIGQSRRLTNLGSRATLSYGTGGHNIKGGIIFQDTILTEADKFGLIDPASNPVCLNANGSPDTNALLTNPFNCSGTLTPNPAFNPLLACYDLTRTAALPASDGCPGSTSGFYTFNGHADIHQFAVFLQDSYTKKNWTLNYGIRGDIYRGLSTASAAEPRVGLSYNIKKTASVIRLSYARTMETPFNENLVLSSTGCNNAVVNAIMSSTVSPCVNNVPLNPGHRNEFHVGVQQAFSRYFVVDAEYIWKYTHEAYDFSVLGNSPITFPIEWASAKIPGFAIRGTMPEFHGLSAFIVMSSVAARFYGPQVSGIGAGPGGDVVFRIDHDERFNQTTHLQYQPSKKLPWIGFDWRYDSGQVAGSVPCAGGDCANGPNGTNSIVDVSQLTPDQQFQAGLYCGSVHATPTTSISPNGLCPASQYGSTLLVIPAAGTENDDHNPPRMRARNLFDAALGDDNLFHGDKRKWSARLEVVNLTNTVALYNFLSTFSGTHYVTPRALTLSLGFHF